MKRSVCLEHSLHGFDAGYHHTGASYAPQDFDLKQPRNGFCVVACRRAVRVMKCRNKIAVLCSLKSKRFADIGIVQG